MQRAAHHRPEGNGASADLEVERLVPRLGRGVQMPPALRVATLFTAALLWLSGVWWLVLHYAFAQQTQFGPLPNPSEPLLMRVHGVVAVAAVFLLGWIAGGHVIERWEGARRRPSGLALAATAAVLLVSGYALFYTTDFAHRVSALTHEGVGVISLLAALLHWWRRRLVR
jgi:hypothetical protein